MTDTPETEASPKPSYEDLEKQIRQLSAALQVAMRQRDGLHRALSDHQIQTAIDGVT